jgi:hypothetical protein
MTLQGPVSSDTETAARLMRAYAERTGLATQQPGRRYLWTDAFAVCNLGALWKRLTWAEHQDINEVMLATSLLPDGCLLLPAMSRPLQKDRSESHD